MKKVIKENDLPIKMWLDDIEEEALEQARHLAALPFAFRHIALMPDSHMGYGMPIGGVLATENVVVPNAVGVDIGCGMLACKTNLTAISKKELTKLIELMRNEIPVGTNRHKQPQLHCYFDIPHSSFLESMLDAAAFQMGTLGGGNHFIEVQKGSDGFIWIMIHSGSRHLGYQIAKYYNDQAKKANKLWHSNVNPKWDLAFLPLDTKLGKAYMDDMSYCVHFAQHNRKKMLEAVKEMMIYVMGPTGFNTHLDVAHNYAALENHFGRNVVVHRKGATKAYAGKPGIIPGSQGTSSFIVEGKGNPESFMSCSHGAGRKMGRKQAKRILDFEKEKAALDKQDIVHSLRAEKNLDEAPGAYKDINTVMKNQKDLVDVLVELKSLAVLKG
jgi:tRNA-splicing ligase RtcB